jgi:hypothetical protein
MRTGPVGSIAAGLSRDLHVSYRQTEIDETVNPAEIRREQVVHAA